jgi:hypothetical protein
VTRREVRHAPANVTGVTPTKAQQSHRTLIKKLTIKTANGRHVPLTGMLDEAANAEKNAAARLIDKM